MEKSITTVARLGGLAAVCGAVTMFAGAALWGASGADLDSAISTGDYQGYLDAVNQSHTLVVANLVVWIAGVFMLGKAGVAMTDLILRKRAYAHIAGLAYRVGLSLALVAFLAWLAIVVQVPAGASDTEIAIVKVFGWFASRADWLATALIVGFGPAWISLGANGEWMPRWLSGLGLLAGLAGIATIVAIFADGLTTYGFAVVPIGLIWTLATGIVMLRINFE